MPEPEFDITYYRVYQCDRPGCSSHPTAEVRIVGPYLPHLQVCRRDVDWAKRELEHKQTAERVWVGTAVAVPQEGGE